MCRKVEKKDFAKKIEKLRQVLKSRFLIQFLTSCKYHNFFSLDVYTSADQFLPK